MRAAPQRKTLFLVAAALSLVALPQSSRGQAKPTPPVPAQKNPPVGPPAPQSKHYPILLLAFGNEPSWSVRIGLKGPERFDRAGYPPIPLEPAEVTYETAADTWIYHAKDSVTGAVVALHLSREACTDAANDTLTATPPLGGKYSFRASVDHAQIGSRKGCARIATELFPKINNQPDPEAEEEAKKHPPVPVSSVIKFQAPVAFAYVNTAGKTVFKRGAVAHVIATAGPELAVSHDGKQLLFVHEEGAENRSIFLYDFATEKSTELVRGNVRQPCWSTDDARFAFLKFVEGHWRLWTAPVASPESATSAYSGDVNSLDGWADAHTLLVDDGLQLSWVAEEGSLLLSLPLNDAFGDVFGASGPHNIRVHPLNPDLLMASGTIPNSPATGAKDSHAGATFGLALYEIQAKRRTLMRLPNISGQDAEWSRDGLQILFTGQEPGKAAATYRVFWDGIGVQKFASGTQLAIGQ
ncbi:MAG TPA: hypothetical protein VE263_11220 [Candidatus Angelobacter sp.]|nr:hypothetical protein [Candidatus Angelobacter sp.]